MRNLVIDQQDCDISVKKDVLYVRHSPTSKPISLPLSQLDTVVVHCRMQLSTSVLCRLAKHNIRLQVHSQSGYGASCHVLGMPQKNIQRRIAQYHCMTDMKVSLSWAKKLVQIKRWQQKNALLQLLAQQKKHKRKFKQSITTLQKLYIAIQNAGNKDSLLGLEGQTARVYLSAYKTVFSPALLFTERNRRPPKDPVNVILSLVYSILYNLIAEALYSRGLDTHLGFYHQPDYGRPSLACDIAEIFKPKLDLWIYELFQESLTVKDFSFVKHAKDSNNLNNNASINPEKPCVLLKSGRKKFYQAFYEKKPTLEKEIRAVSLYFVTMIHKQAMHHNASNHVIETTKEEDICISSYAMT